MSDGPKITLELDADGAVRATDEFGRKLRSIEDQAESSSSGFSKLQASIVALNQGFDLIGRVARTVTGAFGELGEAIQQGSKIDDVTQSFQRLSAQAGTSADVLLNQLNKATGETISNLELMQIANKGLNAGLKPDNFEIVAKAARAYAESVGGDAKQELESFMQGLARGDDRFLKSKGILVDNEKAFADYAKTIGTTGDKLSELGKAEALKAAGMQALIAKTKELGEVENDTGDAFSNVEKAVADAKNEFFKAIGTSKELKEGLQTLAGAIKQLPWDSIVAGAGKAASAIGSALSTLDEFVDGIKVQSLVFQMSGGSIFSMFDSTLEARARQIILQAREIQRVQREAARAASEMANENKELADVIKNETNPVLDQLKPKLDDIAGAAAEAKIDVAALAKEMADSTQGFGVASAGAEATSAAIANLEAEFQRANETLASGFQNIGANFLSDALEDGLSRDSLKEAIRGAGEQAGSLIGEYFGGPIGAALGKVLGDKVGKHFESIADIGKNSKGSIKGLSALGDSFFPGLGSLVGSIFGSGGTPGGEARKAMDKFFDDAFDAQRLAVIVKGQLVELEGLVFDGETLFGGDVDFADGSFGKFFDSLPALAQQGFAGVGTAFEELLGTGEDTAGQLAAVFTNNVGGSLFNLQQLVLSSGASFEQLAGTVVSTFEAGKLKASEAQAALAGIAQVAQKGIPDGIGFTVEAIEHLQAAGIKGGRVSVAAIQAIGFEAEELAIKDIPALIAQLESTGRLSSDVIEQVFAALAANGIDSIEEIKNATTVDLLPVLTQLEKTEFPFSEAANDMQTLIDRVNELPDKIEKKLVFNIETKTDANTQAAIKSGAFGAGGVGELPGL